MTVRNHQHRNNQIIDPATDEVWVPGNSTTEVILEERLSDGSDTGSPAADHRALFLGEDGALHLRDSAGTVTAIGGGGVTVAEEGTPLATTGTTLDFVGAGVVASGTGATKTITIAGGGTGSSGVGDKLYLAANFR